MKNTGKLNLVPEQMAVIPEIQEAFSVANSATLTPEELHELEQEIFFTHDMIAFEAAMAAKQKEIEERTKEIEERTKEVEERTKEVEERTKEAEETMKKAEETMKKAEETTVSGLEQGSRSKQVEIALQLLPLLDDRQIGMATGLTLDEIAQLRRE